MRTTSSRISYFDRMEKQIRDDVLSLNNSKFVDFVDRIYPTEIKIKDTTDTALELFSERTSSLICFSIRSK
jgi:hypothetical protein